MEFQEITGFNPIHDFTKEATLIGAIVNVRESKNEYKSKVYDIKKEDGTVVAVWGSYQIDQAFENLQPNTVVKLEYIGKTEIDGGKSVKNFRISKAI